ncbi:hypothetical protein ABB37_03837 [Leptomonas pyrrhocoris]|uniref:SET domain-containing protein n=1 Tax=Leptomonas pyrrhocoris TaxID=157538 RepID=A0A0M9G367_LEPPY|nr:hypothetical protein ABB37_03837 [Leptomonas pyrrhocoris]KPA81480.1 hypothetical protein ABB37_03837 [Leptomonas pyrrhocoris]|eukprot:XP_015659919.1 hypothetical protein ABB37_03837 [Leptomonas pyrrhocoris]
MASSPSTSPSYLGKNPSPQAFAKYAKKHDIFLHPDVAFLVPTKTMGMGVFAARLLPVGTVVLSCPEASGVSPYMKDAITSPCVAVLHASPAAMQDAVLFDVLVLMSELCRPHSLWRPWLESCPPMIHHLFDLTPNQAAVLGVAPAVAVKAVGETAPDRCSSTEVGGNSSSSTSLTLGLSPLTGVAQALEELCVKGRWAVAQKIISSAPDVWPAEKATLELFCDCLAQVFSRNFHREELAGREGPYLLPGLDILNHSFTANTTFEVRGGGRKHATAFTVVTTRAVKKGEQVYGCYGRIGAARFAVEFQFVTKSVLRNDLVRCSAASLATVATLMHYILVAAAGESTANASALIEDYLNEIPEAEGSVVACPTGDWKPELFGSDSSAEVAALHKDMERRVEQLQRLGILFDEGLYLVRPYATWTEEEAAEGAATFRWSAPSEHEKEVAQHGRVLAATVYLLTAPKTEYEDLYHRITVEWTAPQTAAVARAVRVFVAIKVAAARRQKASLAQVFSSSDRDVVRRQLIHDTLSSEVATLRYYADAVA